MAVAVVIAVAVDMAFGFYLFWCYYPHTIMSLLVSAVIELSLLKSQGSQSPGQLFLILWSMLAPALMRSACYMGITKCLEA